MIRSASVIELTVEDPDQPQVRELLAASDALMASLYPPASNHLLEIDALKRPEVTFVVARESGRALGCGALVKSAGWAELKRMFVSPCARGRGIGRRILLQLERIAIESGVGLLRLETGVRQAEALALYRSAGFAEIGPFGAYAPDPLSVFMEKAIGARRRASVCR
jgi:putative acetyltransferase